jgi:predicted O-linked N-acetylglucosamine transferase (SPINDLY family)
MLLKKVLGRLVGGKPAARSKEAADEAVHERAQQMMQAGDVRGAIRAYREYLLYDPSNVRVLNDLGACLAEIGDVAQAASVFELAYSLDDTFIPAMVNHAKLLHDHNKSEEALEFLRRAKVSAPNFTHVDAVYAGILLKKGDTTAARAFALKAWLGGFDNLRSANSHLFWIGYDDLDEVAVAAEHRFWAETLRPLTEPEPQDDLPPPPAPADTATAPVAPPAQPGERRIRIGYWSPDFRNHSVRYFSRPLIQGHDRSRFELFLIHDIPARDVQTDRFEALADHFYSVADLTDAELRRFLRSLDLDVLVDLAGHTSHNRLSLLQYRMARLQINALGYPPTTGLTSMDAKLVDRHVLTEEASSVYVEQPLVLPSSFWCFDPMEPAPVADAPPFAANGYVTFGCVGNIAKITERVARSWIRILEQVPGSRLLVRSVSFADPLAERALRDRLAAWQLPMDRVDVRPPEGSTAFFTSYNGIDIILDTFPFNGGTTSCFATYMGVPVVTLYGRSLLSRMGLSIMTNLGAADLAVADLDAYVEAAVRLANDPGRVARFKREARERYKGAPLGNGQLFAREFEMACIDLLAQVDAGVGRPATRVPMLPAGEIVRRAYTIMRYSQPEAAQRVLAHCLREYPDAGAAHLLQAQILVWAGLLDQAVAQVQEQLPRFPVGDQVPGWISLARMHLLQQDRGAVSEALQRLGQLEVHDEFDRLQVRLYRACVDSAPPGSPAAAPAAEGACRMLFVVPCDSRPQFELLRQQIEECCACPPGWSLQFSRCGEQDRVAAYRAAMARTDVDVVVLLQKNVQIHQPAFVREVAAAMAQADMVSCGGAHRWARLDWRFDDFGQKAGGFMGVSSEREELVELHLLGLGTQTVVHGLAILDAAVLAVRGGREPPPFDEALLGSDGLMEEVWSHAAGRAGWRLAAHRNLGVFLDKDVEIDSSNRTEARLHCNEQQGFDPFESLRDDLTSLSAPVASAAEAVAVCGTYFAD